jgi:hypothetical protein
MLKDYLMWTAKPRGRSPSSDGGGNETMYNCNDMLEKEHEPDALVCSSGKSQRVSSTTYAMTHHVGTPILVRILMRCRV